MIILDTCIASSLSKINRLSLLQHFKEVVTTQGVINETLRSQDIRVIGPLINATKTWMQILPSGSSRHISSLKSTYQNLSWIDCELLDLCITKKSVLFTDDRYLLHVAENDFGINTWALSDIFEALLNKGYIQDKDIDGILADLKKEDNYSFSKKELKALGR